MPQRISKWRGQMMNIKRGEKCFLITLFCSFWGFSALDFTASCCVSSRNVAGFEALAFVPFPVWVSFCSLKVCAAMTWFWQTMPSSVLSWEKLWKGLGICNKRCKVGAAFSIQLWCDPIMPAFTRSDPSFYGLLGMIWLVIFFIFGLGMFNNVSTIPINGSSPFAE